MIVTIKNLQQQTFRIEIDETQSVLDLKEEIFKKLGGDYVVDRQKLIYSGVVMQDEHPLSFYNIHESKFIVVMLQRNTVLTQVPSTASTAQQTEIQRSNAPAPSEPLPSVPAPNGPTAGSTNPSIGVQTASTDNLVGSLNSESNFLTGDDYSRAVETMVEMGYTREMVEHAMAASFNNPERAFEYLMDGIPDLPIEATSESGAPPEGGYDANAITNVLELLRQNPTLLRAALEQIGITQPALLEQITSNPDAFFNLLNRPAAGNNEGQAPQQPAAPAEGGQPISPERVSAFLENLNVAGQQNGGNAAPATGDSGLGEELVTEMLSNTPPLTRADKDAIERLKALGFPEHSVLQAYIACDKNEQLAANLLLSNDED